MQMSLVSLWVVTLPANIFFGSCWIKIQISTEGFFYLIVAEMKRNPPHSLTHSHSLDLS